MRLESLRNTVQKRRNYHNEKNDYKDIGNFIKKARKKLGVTQEELCEGVCSISYLSKIENNQIIPNDYYVKEIMEKLDIDEIVYTNSLKEKTYLKRVLNATFYMNKKELQDIYDEINEIEHNTLINLCKLGYHIYFEKDEALDYIMMLEHLLNNMSDLEVGMFLYFSATYFSNQSKFKIALDITSLTSEIRIHDKLLQGLIYELSYYIKQRLLIKNSSNEDYLQALTIFNKTHNTVKIMYLSLRKIEFMIKENPKAASMMLSSIQVHILNHQLQDYYYYLNALTAKELGCFKESIMFMHEIDEHSEYYFKKMVLLLEVCVQEDDSMLEEIKTILDGYTPSKKDMSDKVFYHFLKLKQDIDRKEYLRDIAIPFSIKSENYHQLQFYINDIIKICQDNSRYKEALTYYNKYQKELSKIKRIMY